MTSQLKLTNKFRIFNFTKLFVKNTILYVFSDSVFYFIKIYALILPNGKYTFKVVNKNLTSKLLKILITYTRMQIKKISKNTKINFKIYNKLFISQLLLITIELFITHFDETVTLDSVDPERFFDIFSLFAQQLLQLADGERPHQILHVNVESLII